MKALVLAGKESVEVREVPDPCIESPDDAIVRTRLAGICGSDLHVFHGREVGIDAGTVMGHELVGEVVEMGSAVSGFRPGEVVCSPFTSSCGDCFYCRHDLSSRCSRGQLLGWVEGGQGLQGAQAEYVRIPMASSTLLSLPEGLTEDEGLLLGDVLSTGYFCAEQAGVGAGGDCVVVGCGPVGLMAVVSARWLGAGRIWAVDSVDERLAMAAGFGADPLPLEADPVTAVRDLTGGRGADAVLEAVGSAAATRLAYDLVRPGGVVSVVGVHTEPEHGFSPAEAYDKNLTYRVGRCPARHYMPRLASMARASAAPLASIISHRLPLEEGPRGYALFAGKREACVKAVLEP